jgi:hypothetical protein
MSSEKVGDQKVKGLKAADLLDNLRYFGMGQCHSRDFE